MTEPSYDAPAAAPDALLASAPLEILGRITSASNATFLCRLGDTEDSPQCVYKPMRGERPLWDFPDGTLAEREYATYLISEALGWGLVPHTVLRDGPHGRGMAQAWIPGSENVRPGPVDLFAADDVPDGYIAVLGAEDAAGNPVALAHADSPALQTMALFDALVNNPDRKGGHVLMAASGRIYGVDHGICLHAEAKLRTVLWGWAGQDAPPGLVTDAEELRARLDEGAELTAALEQLLTMREVDALRIRVDGFLASRAFPVPSGGHVIPWPPL